MSALGSPTGKVQSGSPTIGIVNTPPPMVKTGQPVIEINCSVCGELTSRTYPKEINGEAVPSAPNEKYPCSCLSP